jgi:hypothetical protein
MNATDLPSAIEQFRQVALASFNDALARVLATTLPPGMTAAEWAADKAKAKAQLSSALDQMVHADTLVSDKSGRDGFTALATTTKAAAESLYTRITGIANDTSGTTSDQDARNQELDALANVLDALGRIAPVALWQKAPETGATSS